MKTLLRLVCLCLVSSFGLMAQAPQKFSYQTVIRNSGGQLLANQLVGIKISVLQGSENGIVVFAERHTPTTNANGLASLQIGTGTVLNGSFSNINWAQGPYFITTETDPNGGTNYTIVSTQQLLSVPYALHANSVSGSVSQTGDTLYIGTQAFVIPGISSANIVGGGQTGITAHSCGATSTHNAAKTYGSMTDQQGNVYKTIVIGTQEWMAENLKTSIYRNGEAISNVVNNSIWVNTTAGAYSFYDLSSQYECPYGKLYNWFAVSDPRLLCPIGWHVATDAEWSILINHLDPNADGGNFNPNSAGSQLKSTGSQYWLNLNQDATNGSGFSGLPGGFRQEYGAFNNIGSNGYWWSSTIAEEIDPIFIWARSIGSGVGDATRYLNGKRNGASVRCIKD